MLLRVMIANPTPLAKAVKDTRLAKGWSKEEAARRANISAITWKRVEDDKPVQEHKLEAICDALGWEPGRAYRLKAQTGPLPEPDPDEDPTIDPTDEDLLETVRRMSEEIAQLEQKIRARAR